MWRIFRRAFTLLVAAALAFLLIIGVIAWFVHRGDAPSIADAPWAIKTNTRIYYASELSMLPDGNPQIRGYWEEDNGGYHYVDGVLPFPKVVFGKVDIVRRPRQ
jgi:hypothetical protein